MFDQTVWNFFYQNNLRKKFYFIAENFNYFLQLNIFKNEKPSLGIFWKNKLFRCRQSKMQASELRHGTMHTERIDNSFETTFVEMPKNYMKTQIGNSIDHLRNVSSICQISNSKLYCLMFEKCLKMQTLISCQKQV